MSSEFAQFLFSFACNKLETSPQLDLRQQLLHSNLIRHILLVHQSSFTSPLSSDQAASHSHQGEQQRQHNPFPMQNTVAAPSSPSSPPQSLLSLTSSSSSQARDTWNPFSFNDELDRIEFTAQQDSDVVMEEQIEPFSSSSTSSPLLDSSYYGFFYQSNSFLQQQQHHLQHLQHQQPQLLELHQIQLQYPLQQHQQKMLDEDQEYLYEASQAQEDWLDAVLEDLIEDDRDDDDVSSPEFDNGSDSDDYDRGTFEDDVERQQLSDPRQSFLPHHRLQFGPDSERGSSLSLSAGTSMQKITSPPPPTTTTGAAKDSAKSPPLAPCPSISPSPPTSIQLTNAHTTSTTSITATTPSTSRFLVRGDNLDFDPTLPQCINNNNNSRHDGGRFALDESYYRPCPLCLGFHCSSVSRSSSSSSSPSLHGEDSLREERFAQLTQELKSTYLQQEQNHQQEIGPIIFEHNQPTLSAPTLHKTFKDPLLFRAPSSVSSHLYQDPLRSLPWFEPSSSSHD